MRSIPYARQWIDKRDVLEVSRALETAWLTQGPGVEAFERSVADYCGVRYAVAVNSGTSALHIACLAIGLKAGDEAITSPITFVASANCVLYCNARPVFADINEETVCVDPESIHKKINSKTAAIIPVHFGGHPCDMDRICTLAKNRNIAVIEDACHALGAEFRGSKIGSCKYSDITVLSFHAVKHITTGEGGMVLTNSKKYYQKLQALRTHGIRRDSRLLKRGFGAWYYEMQTLGFNYRLTDIQCALGLSQLRKIERFLRRRKEIALAYDKAFSQIDGLKLVKNKPYVKSSHHLYVVRFDRGGFTGSRKEIFDEYRRHGIIANVHYIPVYNHPYYKRLGYKSNQCVRAEKYYAEAITLPLYPKMKDGDVGRVIRVTKTIISKFSK